MLIDTPMYDQAMKLCWNIESYKSQVAVVIELLKLQKNKHIPAQVTSEDIMDLLLEESKKELRGCTFNFAQDGYDGDDAMPLFFLMWKVNIGNKIRDVMLEAQMFFMSPETLPPGFQSLEVVMMAQHYANILREKPREASASRLLSPQQVVAEVVPRVLQILWGFPLQPDLSMPSKRISIMSVSLTMTISGRISRALSGGEQVPFPRSVRNDTVLSILIEIRQMYPLEILLFKIQELSPELLTEITDVAAGQICQMCQSRRVAASQTPSAESPATSADDIDLVVTEEQPTPVSERNCFVAVVLPFPPEQTPFPPPPSPSEPPPIAPPPSPSEPPSSPLPASPSEPPPFSPPTANAEPPSFSEIQAREDENEESVEENPPNSCQCTKKKKSFFQKLCCCFADSDSDTE